MTRRSLAVIAGAVLGLLLMWFLLLWGPQGGRLEDAKERETAAQDASSVLELRLARLEASQERAPELMAELDQLRRAVPDDPDLAEFILDANDAALDAGVDFLSIAPGEPETGTAPLVLPTIALSITVKGGYFAVLDYLDALAELPRIVVVDALALTPNEGDAADESISVAITARMFATSAPQIPPPTTTTTAAPAGGESTTTTSASGGS